MTKYLKTIVTYEILHTDEINLDGYDLKDIHYETEEGSASGQFISRETIELANEEMEKALVAQGSDLGFLCEGVE